MVTEDKPLQRSARDFRLVYSSDLPDPLFRIYRNGVLLATTKETTFDVFVDVGRTDRFDIRDDDVVPTLEEDPS